MVDVVVFGVYFNVGECCNFGFRIIVYEDIVEEFVVWMVVLFCDVLFGDLLDLLIKVGVIIMFDY